MAADDTVTPSQLANSVALESHITSAKLLMCEYDANSCVDAASVDPLDAAKYQGVKFAFDYALTDAAAITKAGYMLSYRLTDPYLIELYGGNIDGPITTAGGSEHIGTFHVDKDGVVVIRLDESYIDNKNPPYRGSVEMFANGDANKVAHEITVRKEDTQTNTPAIVIKPNITPATDISIGKNGKLRKHDGSHMAQYSVTVSSNRGTDGKLITVADSVQGLTCEQLTLNVERRNRNGQVERSFAQPVDCAVDNDGAAKFSTQLDGFDADGGSYVLTYDLAVPADMVYDTVHNSATASYIDPHGTEQSKTTTHTLTIDTRTLNAKQGWSAIIANLPLYKTAQSASGEHVITYYSYYIQERQYCHTNGGCVNADKLRAPKRMQANASYAANGTSAGTSTGNEGSAAEGNTSASAPSVSDPSDASDASDVSNVEGYTNGAGITQGVMYMRNMVATSEEEVAPGLPMTGGARWATPQHWAALLALAMAVALYRKVQHI